MLIKSLKHFSDSTPVLRTFSRDDLISCYSGVPHCFETKDKKYQNNLTDLYSNKKQTSSTTLIKEIWPRFVKKKTHWIHKYAYNFGENCLFGQNV